jgi:hypothetical protein
MVVMTMSDTAIQMYSHESVAVVCEESATGKEMEFFKCADCGVRCLMDDPAKMKNINCDDYQRAG